MMLSLKQRSCASGHKNWPGHLNLRVVHLAVTVELLPCWTPHVEPVQDAKSLPVDSFIQGGVSMPEE